MNICLRRNRMSLKRMTQTCWTLSVHSVRAAINRNRRLRPRRVGKTNDRVQKYTATFVLYIASVSARKSERSSNVQYAACGIDQTVVCQPVCFNHLSPDLVARLSSGFPRPTLRTLETLGNMNSTYNSDYNQRERYCKDSVPVGSGSVWPITERPFSTTFIL